MAKLFASEALTRQAADFVDMLGPDGIRSEGDPTAVAGRRGRVRPAILAGHHHLRRHE